MTCRIILLSALLGLAAGTAQAQIAAPSTIAPPPSPLLRQPLAPGAPDIAVQRMPEPAPVVEVFPDIADQFRDEVSAVIGTGPSIRVSLARTEPYGRTSRSLKVGDVYRDDWKIVSLTPQAVGLARSGETRKVDLTVPAKAAVAAQAAADPSRRKTVVTMGSLGLLPPAPPPEPEAAPTETAAQPTAAAIDPAAAAALARALISLGAQAQ